MLHHCIRQYDAVMRTTITLESDVETLVAKVMAERGLSFKDAVNSTLRAALTNGPAVDYSFPSYDLGPASVDTLHALRLAGELEDDERVRAMGIGR